MRMLTMAAAATALLAMASTPKPIKLPKGPGQALVQAKCSTCHALTMVTAKRKTETEWETSLDNMVNRGMQVSDAEFDTLLAYLVKNFGPPK